MSKRSQLHVSALSAQSNEMTYITTKLCELHNQVGAEAERCLCEI